VNGSPLLDNGFCYHGITGVSATTKRGTAVMEPLKAVISIRLYGILLKAVDSSVEWVWWFEDSIV
jgi:hypothetical protein